MIVPFVGPLTGVVVTVNGVPSGSTSPFTSTLPVNGVSSVTVMCSFTVTGGSLTGVTLMVKVGVVQLPPPSHTVTHTLSTPLKFEFGV